MADLMVGNSLDHGDGDPLEPFLTYMDPRITSPGIVVCQKVRSLTRDDTERLLLFPIELLESFDGFPYRYA